MNKPDWKDAPEWANWLARDDDGDWYWWKSRPYFDSQEWISDDAILEYAGYTMNHEVLLEQRPTNNQGE